jgi:putative inorganic carbon (HCO3(-)) transporter
MALRREEIPVYLTGAAAVSALISIAACEILIGAAILAMLVTRTPWRIPPIWLPFIVFVAATLLSLVANGHYQQGWPQIRKFYVYAMLFLVASVFRSAAQLRFLAVCWAGAAALSAAWALNQFYNKYEDAIEAHQDFYRTYVSDRITGFTTHWMTFSEQMMLVLLVIGALVFFSTDRRWAIWLIAIGALLSVALIAAETRSVWFATAAGGVYLLWFWKRWTVIALPVVAGIILLANPFEIGDRVISAFRPNGDLDSNAHRRMCRLIGYQMIKAHPIVGIGPEQVAWQYLNYLPRGTRLPLPAGYYLHLHNIYIHYAAELGIPAMLAMLWMLLRPLYDFSRALMRAPPGVPMSSPLRWALQAGIAAIIAILAGGYYEKNIGDSHVLALFLAITGCGYAAAAMLEENKCKA